MGQKLLITGTDTGAGKTVLTGLLLAYLQDASVSVRAMKPFCTGDRDDARRLQALHRERIPLETVNPFYFPAPLAPAVASRQQGREVTLDEAVETIEAAGRQSDWLLIEGVGGLFVPLGTTYTVADLIRALDCSVVIAGRNRLGILNHALLTVHALRGYSRHDPKLVLMQAPEWDESVASNRQVLQEWLAPLEVTTIPLLEESMEPASRRIQNTLASILGLNKLPSGASVKG